MKTSSFRICDNRGDGALSAGALGGTWGRADSGGAAAGYPRLSLKRVLQLIGGGVTHYLEVRTVDDVDRHLAAIRASAARVQSWIAAQSGDPLDLLRRMKFEPV